MNWFLIGFHQRNSFASICGADETNLRLKTLHGVPEKVDNQQALTTSARRQRNTLSNTQNFSTNQPYNVNNNTTTPHFNKAGSTNFADLPRLKPASGRWPQCTRPRGVLMGSIAGHDPQKLSHHTMLKSTWCSAEKEYNKSCADLGPLVPGKWREREKFGKSNIFHRGSFWRKNLGLPSTLFKRANSRLTRGSCFCCLTKDGYISQL